MRRKQYKFLLFLLKWSYIWHALLVCLNISLLLGMFCSCTSQVHQVLSVHSPCSHLLIKERKKKKEICREFFERFFVNWVPSPICFSVDFKMGRRVEVSFKPVCVVAQLTWRLLNMKINSGILTMFFSWWKECISVWAFFSVREIFRLYSVVRACILFSSKDYCGNWVF